MNFRRAACALSLLAEGACRSQPGEPVPAAPSYELVIAPPGALGARAAGTPGAPPAPAAGELAEPGAEESPDPEPEEDLDGGTNSDGGHSPDATPGVTL